MFGLGWYVFWLFSLTGLDYLIHSTLYGFGLQFDWSWFVTSQILYYAVWQGALFGFLAISHSWRAFTVAEAFFFSGGQDLVFFGVWNRMVFPNGEWAWMSWTIQYHLFGTWNTALQVNLSILFVALASTFVIGMKLLELKQVGGRQNDVLPKVEPKQFEATKQK
jgi:hypothetical protein